MRVNGLTGSARINRKFSLLVACGLLAITVIQLPNLVDLWDQARSEDLHRSEMLAGLSKPQRWKDIDKQRTAVQQQLEEYERAMVDDSAMPAIQSELMEMVRGSGCQLRKTVIQAASSDDWKVELAATEWAEDAAETEESAYLLTTEQLNLSLTGSLYETLDFLGQLRTRGWLMRITQINFSRDPEIKEHLIVEASLAFYRLQEKQHDEEGMLVHWRDGTRANPTN